MTVRRTAGMIFAALVMIAASLAIVSPAQAYTINNVCEVGEYKDNCLYFRSNYGGAKAGIAPAVPDYANPPVYFPGPGEGSGTRIWNNAGSGQNHDTVCTVRVWYSANYGAPYQQLNRYPTSGYASPTLGPVNNDNRSQNWTC